MVLILVGCSELVAHEYMPSLKLHIIFDAAVDVNKCLEEIKFSISLDTCAVNP